MQLCGVYKLFILNHRRRGLTQKAGALTLTSNSSNTSTHGTRSSTPSLPTVLINNACASLKAAATHPEPTKQLGWKTYGHTDYPATTPWHLYPASCSFVSTLCLSIKIYVVVVEPTSSSVPGSIPSTPSSRLCCCTGRWLTIGLD